MTRPLQLPPPTLHDVRRVCRDYREAFGRNPNLLRPRRFSEKMQWRKLFDLNPIYAVLSDKLAVRDFIAERVGRELLTTLLWIGDSPNEIPFDALEPPYILKCNHASGLGFRALVTDRADFDIEQVRAKLRSGLAHNYGAGLREPGYVPVRPCLLAERLMLEEDGSAPLEHKIFVFDGRAQIVQTVVLNQARERFDAIYDRDWRWLGWNGENARYEGKKLERPERLDEFLALAERLSAGFDHLRVDLYEWKGEPRVGELTLYHISGLVRLTPDESDFILGDFWQLRHPLRRALASMLWK